MDVAHDIDSSSTDFYRRILRVLDGAHLPFMIGGYYALAHYTGMSRDTKDLDLFIRPSDVPAALAVLARVGHRAELVFPHWLAKIVRDEGKVDVIFSSGNGVAQVDDAWLARAEIAMLGGEQVRICPVEEMIWSKAYVMERERYDGADVAHLIRARGRSIDWRHLLDRFGADWAVLLSHLVLFDFIYPGHRDAVPDAVIEELLARWEAQRWSEPGGSRLCRGPLLSREQYLHDLEQLGYRDARLPPHGNMSPEDIARWTAAIDGSG